MDGFQGIPELFDLGLLELMPRVDEVRLLYLVSLIVDHVQSQEIRCRVCLSTAYIKHGRHIDKFEVSNIRLQSFYVGVCGVFLA